MAALNSSEARILRTLADQFYSVVPLKLRTFCPLTSRISQSALARFGIRAELVACQLWYAAPGVNCIVGFNGNPRQQGKWDGHVMCGNDKWFIDASVHHLRKEFKVAMPDVVLAPRIVVPSQSIARVDLSETERVWWFHPPPGVDATVPGAHDQVISGLAARLAARVQQALAAAPTRECAAQA